MTTPTREQVVQWADQANGIQVRGVHPGMIGFYPQALLDFAILARADLEATVAEQSKEIDRLKNTPPHQRQDLHCVVSDIASECREFRQQLQASQAREAQLREALKAWKGIAENCSIESGCCGCGEDMSMHSSPMMCGHSPTDMADSIVLSAVEKTEKALSTPSDDTALRVYSGKIAEACAKACEKRGEENRIADGKPNGDRNEFYCADDIRRGEWEKYL